MQNHRQPRPRRHQYFFLSGTLRQLGYAFPILDMLPADDAFSIDEEVPGQLSAVRCQDLLVDFSQLKAVFTIPCLIGVERRQRFR